MACEYRVDEYGNEKLVLSEGLPYKGHNTVVMMTWEQDYMNILVAALNISQTCAVLEVGFGQGFSATAIQKCKPRSYTLIECDAAVLERAREWAKDYANVTIIEGYWQHTLASQMGGAKFDKVFFDDFPLPLEQQLAVDDTSQKAITAAAAAVASHDTAAHGDSRWSLFVQACMPHLAKGAKITGYMARAVDIDVAGFEMDLSMTTVHVPDDCTYFPYSEACVPVLTFTGTSKLVTAKQTAKRRKMHNLVLSSLGLDPG